MTIGKLAAIGCSGPISKTFVHGFLDQGADLRLLARDTASAAERYPEAEIVQGSLMNSADVARAVEGVDAAFVLTPMGLNNDPSFEIEAAQAIIAGLKAGNVKHVIYTSALGTDKLRGVGVLDSKYQIEKMIEASGIPYTILRCGTYMEDVFDLRLELLNRGTFLFPVSKHHRFAYTADADVPRFIVEEILKKKSGPLGTFDFLSQGTYAVTEVEALLSEASGRKIKASAKVPTYYMFSLLLPFFRLKGHRFSSIIPLIQYFDKHGYTGTGRNVAEVRPDFKMTSLREHLQMLWHA